MSKKTQSKNFPIFIYFVVFLFGMSITLNVDLITRSHSWKCANKDYGAAAQVVCIEDSTVYKSVKQCGILDPKCIWTRSKQRYTYHYWATTYKNLDIISDMALIDSDRIIMNFKTHHDIQPNKTTNKLMLQELQDTLVKNNHLLLDAYPKSNAFLESDGTIILIDFTLVPSFLNTLPIGIEFLEEYPNIAAGNNTLFKTWYQ